MYTRGQKKMYGKLSELTTDLQIFERLDNRVWKMEMREKRCIATPCPNAQSLWCITCTQALPPNQNAGPTSSEEQSSEPSSTPSSTTTGGMKSHTVNPHKR